MRACLRCRIRNKINESCWGVFFFHQNIFWCKKAGQRAVTTCKRSAASLFPIDAVVWQLKALGALTVSHTNCRFHFVYHVRWAINGTSSFTPQKNQYHNFLCTLRYSWKQSLPRNGRHHTTRICTRWSPPILSVTPNNPPWKRQAAVNQALSASDKKSLSPLPLIFASPVPDSRHR